MLGPAIAHTDFRDVQVAAVVSATWAGRTWRLATRGLTGDKFHADPGLLEVPDLSDEVSLSPGGDVGVSVPVAFVLPAINVATYIAAGFDLEDLDIEIAWVWHRDGVLVHEWAARDVRAEGHAIEAVHGDPTQPTGYIACTVEDSPYRTERPLARWTWAVSADTWPDSPEQGERYPLALGRPDPNAVGGGPRAPVLTQITGGGSTTNSTVLVSIGWCRSRFVTLIDSDGASEVFDITYTQDGLGQTCAIVDVGSAGTISIADGTTYTSAWTAGAALAPHGRTDPMSLASYLLSLGGADIDLAEWLSLSGLLDLEMGGYIDDPESRAWEVARDVLTGLPVTMRRARDGWAPVLLDPHLAARVAAETWTDNGPYRRVSSWSGVEDSRIARVEVSGEAGEVLVGDSADRDAALPHAWIRHLKRLGETALQASWSWVLATQYRQASWAARMGAMAWEAAAWQVPAAWGRQAAGRWVYIAADKRYALVQRRTLAGGVWDYTLVRPRGR